jgi:acyl-CoA synthetase (NDP forming)
VAPGLELYLGILRDPMVGPIVMVGLGGGTVEAVRRRRLALPPLGPEQAVAMFASLGVLGPGSGTGDSSAVVDAVLAVSQIAVELGDAIAALDVNPLVVTPDGAIAVDALALPRIAGSLHV